MRDRKPLVFALVAFAALAGISKALAIGEDDRSYLPPQSSREEPLGKPRFHAPRHTHRRGEEGPEASGGPGRHVHGKHRCRRAPARREVTPEGIFLFIPNLLFGLIH